MEVPRLEAVSPLAVEVKEQAEAQLPVEVTEQVEGARLVEVRQAVVRVVAQQAVVSALAVVPRPAEGRAPRPFVRSCFAPARCQLQGQAFIGSPRDNSSAQPTMK